MDELQKNGLAGVCVLLTINILMKVAEFVWSVVKQKQAASESAVTGLTEALQECTSEMSVLVKRLDTLEVSFKDFPKIKADVRRVYTALKTLSGDKWNAVREEMFRDTFES